MALSPMMQQYLEIKDKNSDCILFFRLGDFYEMFFDDAVLVSGELELTLTGKNCGLEERAPMCGVPFHSADSYIEKLIEKGYKVAICEQVEDPREAKGLVKREVVQIVTPGTITSSNLLNESENNYIASAFVTAETVGFAYCDISTGEICVTQISDGDNESSLWNELVRIDASEAIINDSASNFISLDYLENVLNIYVGNKPEEYFNFEKAKKGILKQFKSGSLKELELEDKQAASMALGALLAYFEDTQMQNVSHIMKPLIYNIGSHMALDRSTIRNLEITEKLFENTRKGSLLEILDKTGTAMGARKMKQWLREPLNDADKINDRLDAVEAISNNIIVLNNIRESLKSVYDLERLSGRIATGRANAKDLIALKSSLFVLPEIKMDMADLDASLIRGLVQDMDELGDIYSLIDAAIEEEPPFTIKEGSLIKEGYSKDLDDLNNSIKDSKIWLAELESVERERVEIPNLKVGYNKVFGYYIEITKSNYDKIPDNYIRKQTLANAERFITPELKETENIILNAETKINNKEYELFCEIREKIGTVIHRIQKTSAAISSLDVLASFAEVSNKLGYVRPVVNDGDKIQIEKGRHPVIEQTVKNGIFVSNDTYIDRTEAQMLLITGPNMSGKSTYMRQTAIIVLMAQSGCFVPCEKAEIGVCDRIFTRIGASDNLAAGESTFYVEMSELAYILKQATEKSLIILDEIGRGTSTFDGLSIAWAVCEYLCKDDIRIRTLFASHYHELTQLENEFRGFKNLNVDVAEEDGDVVFLHKIIEGSASKSYGIHVAKIAGVPKEILTNAKTKLDSLERESEELREYTQISFKLN